MSEKLPDRIRVGEPTSDLPLTAIYGHWVPDSERTSALALYLASTPAREHAEELWTILGKLKRFYYDEDWPLCDCAGFVEDLCDLLARTAEPEEKS